MWPPAIIQGLKKRVQGGQSVKFSLILLFCPSAKQDAQAKEGGCYGVRCVGHEKVEVEGRGGPRGVQKVGGLVMTWERARKEGLGLCEGLGLGHGIYGEVGRVR